MNSNNETKVDTTISIAKGKTTELIGTNVIVTNTSKTLTANILKDKVYLKSIDDKLNEIGTYKNLSNPSSEQWINDFRLNQTPVAVAMNPANFDGFFISNAIPLKKGDIIRVKGAFDNRVYHNYISIYTNLTLDNPLGQANFLDDAIVIDSIDTNIKTYEYTFTGGTEGVQYYARVSARTYYPKENIIITVNEEIDGATKYSPRWLVMGDSISSGYTSYFDENNELKVEINYEISWVQKLARKYGYAYTNKADGGQGWANGDYNARAKSDLIDFSNYDFVTIAYGHNDWKYKANLGTFEDDINTVDAMIPNMIYVINKILADNPNIQIVVITPINSSVLGDSSTNWGLNYDGENASGPGLQQIYEIEKQVVELYGDNVKLLDMTHSSLITNENIKVLLPDNGHPNDELHTLMADEIGEYISQYIK